MNMISLHIGLRKVFIKRGRSVLEIGFPNVSTSMVCHNIFLIYDRQAEILLMYKIDTHTSMIIDDYRIGEDYLFIKYENTWKRIY